MLPMLRETKQTQKYCFGYWLLDTEIWILDQELATFYSPRATPCNLAGAMGHVGHLYT